MKHFFSRFRSRLNKKVKSRRRDPTKKVRVLCDFCGSCSSYEHNQEDESLFKESELKRLRLLTRRITGKDLNGLRYDDLRSLETNLDKALVNVQNQAEKTEQEEPKMISSVGKQDEPMSEFQRLWLLKERMSGRELGNMSHTELCLLACHIRKAATRMCSYPLLF